MFHIVLTFDDKYIDMGLACINSIVDTRLKSKDKIKVDVLCFKGYQALAEVNIKNLEALSTKNTIVSVVKVNVDDKKYCDELVDNAKKYGKPTHPIMWLRLLIPKLYTKRDTVLYVDCDICTRVDLKQFIDTYNKSEQWIVGFQHRVNGVGGLIENSLTAAFFVFNLKVLDKDKWFELLEKYNPTSIHDEDCVNQMIGEVEHSYALPCEKICNRACTTQIPKLSLDNDDYLMYINKRFDEQYRTAEIVHYAGEPKPKFDRANFTDSLFAFNYLAAKRKLKLRGK